MFNLDRSFAQLGLKGLFLVWGAPQGSRRSEQIARELGIDLEHIYLIARQGSRYAPLKYAYQGIATLALLVRRRPQLVFIQDPPIFGAFFVYLYSLLYGTKFIIDIHTNALTASFWQWTLPLHRFLSRRALINIVTNDHLAEMISSWNANSLVLQDPPLKWVIPEPMALEEGVLNAVMISAGDFDEPVGEVVEAARGVQDVHFYITGNLGNRFVDDANPAPSNVHFTGYLRKEFFALLEAADLVICLTTVNHTFLSGANEALWLAKPLITSDWPLLQSYFNKGTLHVDNTAETIQQAVVEMKNNLSDFQAGIKALQEERRCEWYQRAEELLCIIQRSTSVYSDRMRHVA